MTRTLQNTPPPSNTLLMLSQKTKDGIVCAIRKSEDVNDWPLNSRWTPFTSEQLLLFGETEEDRLKREVFELKKQLDKIRRAQFAKIGQINKAYHELMNEFHQLKAAICRTQTQSHMQPEQ